MSILLVDIGNTRIKWASLTDSRLGRQRAAVHRQWGVREFERNVLGSAGTPRRILVSSVAGPRTNRLLVRAARRAGLVTPQFVKTVRRAAGVTTRYEEPWRLGVDRFVAVIGAYHLARGRPACVISIGTALTVDLVDETGRHEGGAIVPGPEMMVASLLTRTNGIRQRAGKLGAMLLRAGRLLPAVPDDVRSRCRGRQAAGALFARSTHAAVEQGARYAVAAMVDRAVEEARKVAGRRLLVILTGGGADAVRPLIRSPHESVADLVLRGLAAIAGDEAAVRVVI